MSSQEHGERPWWSSSGEDLLGEDAERGRDRSGPDDGRGSAWSWSERSWSGDPSGGSGRGGGQAHADVCQACPVCAFLRVVGDARPEVVSHLVEAARHLTLAAKAAVDAQASRTGGAGAFQRIDLDED